MKHITARCLICNEILKSYSSDTSSLIEHLEIKHPEINLQTLQSSFDTIKKLSESSNETIEETLKKLSTSTNDTTDTIKSFTDTKNESNETIKLKLENPEIVNQEQILTSVLSEVEKPEKEIKCIPNQYFLNQDDKIGPKLSRRDIIRTYNLIESYDIYHDKTKQCRNSLNPEQIPKSDKETQTDGIAEFPERGMSMEEKKIFDAKTNKQLYKRKYIIKNPFLRTCTKRKLYRTSIEKWRPGRSQICCPCCGKLNVPVIRNRTDKISSNTIGAAFIVSCWPLCFLPCNCNHEIKEYLYCSVCYYFLGMYDHKTEIIHPNSDLFDNKIPEK